MKRTLFLAALMTTTLAGCGDSNKSETSSTSSHNDSAIANAEQSEQSKAEIIAKLRPLLKLHEYAGVDNAFTVPPGSPDVKLGEDGNECSIEDVTVGKEDVSFVKDDDQTLVSPDGTAAVKVEIFQGTPISVCLKAARDALGW